MSILAVPCEIPEGTKRLTELDIRTLFSCLLEHLLAPRLNHEHVVNGDDVNVLDALGFVLVVVVDVCGNLRGAGGGEPGRGSCVVSKMSEVKSGYVVGVSSVVSVSMCG